MNSVIASGLSDAQRKLLQELEDKFPEFLMVGRPSHRSLRIARALERKGMLTIDTDESGFRYAWLTGDQYADLNVSDEQEDNAA